MKFHSDVEAAIARIVAAGGTVRMPIPWDVPAKIGDIDGLDAHWHQYGVRVYEEANSHYFPARVQHLRRKYGMPYHTAYKNHMVFEPEPAAEIAHGS